MAPPDTTDLLSLDRDVARADAAIRRWSRGLAAEAGETKGRAGDAPLDPWRHVAGQSTYEALERLKPTSQEAPLRDGLRRWVYALLQARIGATLEVELAEATSEASARVSVPEARKVSWREAWHGVLAAPTSIERGAWLEGIAQTAPQVASLVRRREERREEVARRLGLERASLLAARQKGLTEAAEALLDLTGDLARDLQASARRRLELPVDPPAAVDALAIAMGRDAPEGWPPRLASRWLEETFGSFTRGLRLDLPPLPEPLGAASFARACASFGSALRVAGSSPSLPFALAREPEFVAAHRFGFVFGALAASGAFQRRVLGNVARVAEAQRRVLGRTALLQARLEAGMLLLGSSRARDRFEDLTHRLFGAPLPPSLAGAWPLAGDAPARFVGLVTAYPLHQELIARFDEDWFANPRAVTHLRAIASGPAWEEPAPDLVASVSPLARAFEQALG